MENILINYISAIGQSKGIVYAGANEGQEIPLCKNLTNKVYAFEPIKDDSVWSKLIKHQSEKVECFNVALTDFNGKIDFYTATNNYQSSSILKPKNHIQEFPNVGFVGKTVVEARRLDSYDFEYDVLIMDVQGAELSVLNGISNFNSLKLVIAEYTTNFLYDNACTFDDVYKKLTNNGLSFYETFGIYFNPKTKTLCGNAVFLRV